MPYTVEVPLVHLLVHRTVYGNLPRFRGVLELTMIPFCGIQVPSVVFKHLDDLLRFICLHIYSALIHTAKVTKLIPPAKQLSGKVFDLILFNNLCQQKNKFRTRHDMRESWIDFIRYGELPLCNWSQCAILARWGAEGDYKVSREKIDEYLELSSFLPIFAIDM